MQTLLYTDIHAWQCRLEVLPSYRHNQTIDSIDLAAHHAAYCNSEYHHDDPARRSGGSHLAATWRVKLYMLYPGRHVKIDAVAPTHAS